jgi:uncharacterized protein (DUF58 family)
VHEHALTPSRGGRLLRPTRGAVAVIPVATAVELIGRLIGSNWVTMAAAALIGGLIGAAVLTSNPCALTIARSAPARMRAGQSATVRITVSNRRRLRALGPLLITDRAPGLPEATVFIHRVRPGVSVVADVVRTPSHRGRWADGGSVTVDARSALGGFSRRRVWTGAEATVVHPGSASPVQLRPGSSTSTRSTSGSGRAGRGTEVLGLREWRPGDGAGAVHWRSSARRGSLSVLERDLPLTDDLIVALGRCGTGEDWEHAVSRVATTAAAAFRRGSRVTVVTGAGASTQTSLTMLLDWFADIERHPAATGPQILRTTARGDASVVRLTTEDRS